MSKYKNIGLVGIVQNPSLRFSSHNAGWTYCIKSISEKFFDSKVTVLNEKQDWNSYDALVITEGVNYKEGQFNLFGGVSEALMSRLNKLNDYKGEVFSIHNQFLPYELLASKRNLDINFNKEIAYIDSDINENQKLILGDSHSLSVYEKGWNISRNDGKTMHGFLKEGIESFLSPQTKELRFYAGNIDVRHHLCRKFSGFEVLESINAMIKNLESQLLCLFLENIEIVELLPIECEARKIPKTGYFEKKPYWGSFSNRSIARNHMNLRLKEMCDANGFKFLPWKDMTNDMLELDFKYMESGSSVHLAPTSYMFLESFITIDNGR